MDMTHQAPRDVQGDEGTELGSTVSKVTEETGEMIKWKEYKARFYMTPFPEQPIESYADVPSKLNFILVGKTGSGKSATGNTLVGRDDAFDENCGTTSQTKTIKPVLCKVDNKTINVVDTPGLFDTHKDFTNEELVLEIVKTAINFREGVHLFLLVMKGNIRFTDEEEKVVKDLEKLLSKDIHRYSVIILTNAQAHFGKKRKKALKEYMTLERKNKGYFGRLVDKVGERVIAIENCFDEEGIAYLQRQSFLHYLIDVVSKNKGEFYSNGLFVEISKRVEQDELERQRRIEREQQLSEMRRRVEEFLIGSSYLESLSVENLRNIRQVLEGRIEYIRQNANVMDLKHINNDDLIQFFKTFVTKHEHYISSMSASKLKEMELEVSNIGSHLQTFLKDEPTETLDLLQKCLRENNFDSAKGLLSGYAVKLSKRQDFNDGSDHIEVLLQQYCVNNREFLRENIQNILDTKSKMKEIEENFLREQKKNEALEKISNVIDEDLEDYLASKTIEELREVESYVNRKDVPQDLLKRVKLGLTTEEIRLLGNYAIKKEILIQIGTKSHRIAKFKEKAAKCFPPSTVVQTKTNGYKCISSVQVNDEILVFDDNGYLFHEKVYLISHANPSEEVLYVRINTENGKILFISPNHLLPIGTLNTTMPAKDAGIGDKIFSISHGNLTQDTITSLSYEKCRGAFCPMTMSGYIVVNDVAASCYTTFVNPTLAHILLSPFRIMFKYLPTSVFNKMLPYDSEEGMPLVLTFSHSLVNFIRSSLKLLKEIIVFRSVS